MNPQCKLDASNFSSIKSSKEQLEEWRRQLGSELFVRVECDYCGCGPGSVSSIDVMQF